MTSVTYKRPLASWQNKKKCSGGIGVSEINSVENSAWGRKTSSDS